MAVLHIPEPNKKQKLFLAATQKYIAYGGARGGGKSWSVRTKASILANHYSGIRIMIMRRKYTELSANHIEILKKELVPGFARYNATEKQMTFRNGSVIKFMYCKNDADLDNIQGHEYDVIFVDEATNLTEKQLRAITACCRGVNDFPKHVYFTMNPGGPGHGFIKRLFIDRRFNDRENPDEYTFIQALVDDNTALMEAQPDYVAQLEALPGKLREAWRFGRWDVFEGQVFGEFVDDPEHYKDRRFSHVIEPFKVPESWRIYRGFDWGYAKPFSVGWYAMDHDNIMYRIRELYGCTGRPDEGTHLDPVEQARRIREAEQNDPVLRGRVIHGVADPAIFDESRGESIAAMMERSPNFLHWKPGDHTRLAGKMQFHYRLNFDADGRPMLQVFNTCKHFIRTLPNLVYDESNVEDIDTRQEDHIYDECRYVLMENPISPPARHTALPPPDDPLDLHRQARFYRI